MLALILLLKAVLYWSSSDLVGQNMTYFLWSVAYNINTDNQFDIYHSVLKVCGLWESVLGIFKGVAKNWVAGSWYSALNLVLNGIESRSAQELVLLYYKELSTFCDIILQIVWIGLKSLLYLKSFSGCKLTKVQNLTISLLIRSDTLRRLQAARAAGRAPASMGERCGVRDSRP